MPAHRNGTPSIDVVFVMDHPAQHFSPGLSLAAEEGRFSCVTLYWDDFQGGYFDDGFDRQVEWDVDLLSGYDFVATDPQKPAWRRALFVWRWLQRERPRIVVISGWGTLISRLAIAWCRATRTPHFFYGDSTWQHPGETARLPRAFVLRLLFARGANAISTGTFNREFYILHGMQPQRIVNGLIPIDIDRFTAARATKTDEDHITGRPVVIGFAGKLIQRKGADELLQAVALLPPDLDWVVRIVGDGVLRSDLEHLASSLGIRDRVEFKGFVNQQEMPNAIAAFDVFVAPSRMDLRILAVAEAMAAGTPVVVSDATAVWGAGDLVQHGQTGLVYRTGEPAELAQALEDLITDPGLRSRLVSAATVQVETAGPAGFPDQIERALALVRRG